MIPVTYFEYSMKASPARPSTAGSRVPSPAIMASDQ